MRTIKIKLPFTKETEFQRKEQLLDVAEILSNDLYFRVIEEKHFFNMSYIVIIVFDNLEFNSNNLRTG